MYLIVGLGNPEEDYAKTRHNMGFHTINKIAKKYNMDISKSNFQGLYEIGVIEGEKVILLKPQTHMNLSGKSIKQFAHFYKIEKDQIIVIYDDIDLDVGTIRIRKNGGAGTHNGMRSVIGEIGTEDFPRVRIGIGTPIYKEDIINYVIGHIPEEEANVLDKATDKAALAVIEIIKSGIDTAMNRFN